ncbi:arsenate reductase ArsC [bacterium CPR1]|nr:arsenate reductase ArsC [bacterium CPR1]
MAEGFGRQLGAGVLDVASAGSRPLGRIHEVVREAMAEKGIDLASQTSKGLDQVDPGSFDYLITLCAEEECPYVPGPKQLHWGMPNPAGKDVASVRPIRDAIEGKVRELVEELREA